MYYNMIIERKQSATVTIEAASRDEALERIWELLGTSNDPNFDYYTDAVTVIDCDEHLPTLFKH